MHACAETLQSSSVREPAVGEKEPATVSGGRFKYHSDPGEAQERPSEEAVAGGIGNPAFTAPAWSRKPERSLRRCPTPAKREGARELSYISRPPTRVGIIRGEGCHLPSDKSRDNVPLSNILCPNRNPPGCSCTVGPVLRHQGICKTHTLFAVRFFTYRQSPRQVKEAAYCLLVPTSLGQTVPVTFASLFAIFGASPFADISGTHVPLQFRSLEVANRICTR